MSTSSQGASTSTDTRHESARKRADLYRHGEFSLSDTWIPIAHLPRITRHPITRTVHNQPVALWRENGKIRAIGASAGQRSDLHSEISHRYPVVERYGYAWIWYGNPERGDEALLPHVPFLPLEGGLPRHFWGSHLFNCTYELACENLMDSTHADFVHSQLMGDPLTEEDQVRVESTSETVTMFREARGRKTPKSQRAMVRKDSQDLLVVVHVHLRSGVMLNLGAMDPPGMRVNLFHPVVPESPERNRLNYTFNVRPGKVPAAPVIRQLFPLMGHAIARQDNRVMRAQNPQYLVASERADLSSRFDAPGLEYRKRMKALVERQRKGDFSYLADADPGQDMSEIFHY